MIITFNIGTDKSENFDMNIDIMEKFYTKFLSFEKIRQKIRLTDKIDKCDFTSTEFESSFGCGKIIKFDNNFVWANSNINMNPCLYPISNKLSESVICYITLPNNLKLLSYSASCRILQTYHMNGKYNGCVIVCSIKELMSLNGNGIISLFVYDKTDKRISKVDCAITVIEANTAEEYNFLPIIEKSSISKDKFQILKNLNKKYKNELKFKIKDEDELLTATYIVDSSKVDTVKKIVEKIKNANIIVVDDNLSIEEKKSILQEKLAEKVRAVTLVGVRVPLSVLKELKMIYVFSYDTETKTLKCIKSN